MFFGVRRIKKGETQMKRVLMIYVYLLLRIQFIKSQRHGQVDGFRNSMKNELKTRPYLILNTDPNFLNLHIDKAAKTCGDKQNTNKL